MYRYYYNASTCFVYLEDVPGGDVHGYAGDVSPEIREQEFSSVCRTRWLSRGWTLQELLAPSRRCFFAGDWSVIAGGDDLLDALAATTKIDRGLLQNRDLLPGFCVAERMSWAAKRQTTGQEDVAYSLMGLFGVQMPVVYGEGARNAFKRLQLEIMQSSFHVTLFAWRGRLREQRPPV